MACVQTIHRSKSLKRCKTLTASRVGTWKYVAVLLANIQVFVQVSVWGSKSAESWLFLSSGQLFASMSQNRIRTVNHFSVVGAECQYNTNKYELRHNL